MSAHQDHDTTVLFDAVLESRIHVERRHSDGMVWLRIEDMHGDRSKVVAIDRDMAWALARSLLREPESLSQVSG